MGKFNEVWGDLLKDAEQYNTIMHGCNCFCSMSGGIAAGVAKVFPEAERVDYRTERGNINKLGGFSKWESEDVTVINAYTQFQPGCNVNYTAIAMCLQKINHLYKGKSIALPMIGGGIAGGDFTVIRLMIINLLYNCDVTIVYWPGDKDKIEDMGIILENIK